MVVVVVSGGGGGGVVGSSGGGVVGSSGGGGGGLSPRPEWLSCACALHFLASRLFHSDVPVLTFCSLLCPLCHTHTHPILSSLLSPAPPRHEYILNGTWRSH